MNVKVLGITALAVAAVLGFAYASHMNDPKGNMAFSNATSNATANSVITLGHRHALVNCAAPPTGIGINDSLACGNWTVTLKGINSAGNITTSTFLVTAAGVSANSVSANAMRINSSEEIEVITGISGRACMHYPGPIPLIRGDDHGFDEGIGAGHSCLFVTVDSTASGSATVQLTGLTFVNVHMPPPFVSVHTMQNVEAGGSGQDN